VKLFLSIDPSTSGQIYLPCALYLRVYEELEAERHPGHRIRCFLNESWSHSFFLHPTRVSLPSFWKLGTNEGKFSEEKILLKKLTDVCGISSKMLLIPTNLVQFRPFKVDVI